MVNHHVHLNIIIKRPVLFADILLILITAQKIMSIQGNELFDTEIHTTVKRFVRQQDKSSVAEDIWNIYWQISPVAYEPSHFTS